MTDGRNTYIAETIKEAAKLLDRKALEIASDVENEKVSRITIYIDVDFESSPTVNIEKYYSII